jgi:hypothetical protein
MRTVLTTALCIAVMITAAHAAEDDKAAAPGPPGFWTTLFSLDELKEKGPDEKRWFFTLGAWYEIKLGNTDTTRANGSALLEYKNGIEELILSWQQFYGEYVGKRNEERGSGIAKYDHYLVSLLEYFVFSQWDYNIITGLRIRGSSGTGLKLVFFRNRYWTTDFSAAPVYEYERHTAKSPRHDFRASFRYRVKIHVFGLLHLNCSVFYVPQIRDFGEYRFNIDADATLNVTRNADTAGGLLLKGGYKRLYDTYALPGKKKLDQFIYAQVQLLL